MFLMFGLDPVFCGLFWIFAFSIGDSQDCPAAANFSRTAQSLPTRPRLIPTLAQVLDGLLSVDFDLHSRCDFEAS